MPEDGAGTVCCHIKTCFAMDPCRNRWNARFQHLACWDPSSNGFSRH